jgi:arginase
MPGLLGIPNDSHSSFLTGAAAAPARIREVLHNGSSNLTGEDGTDLSGEGALVDLDQLPVEGLTGEAAFTAIQDGVAAALKEDDPLILLGGDHAITNPIIAAHAAHFGALDILHIDAHPDLYDALDGDRYSHGSPFARIMERGDAARLVQIGIRAINPHGREQAARFGVEMIEMNNWAKGCALPSFERPVYLSLDLDGIDPAYAPGVSHHEPGGLTTREVLQLIQNFEGRLIGADIVELNPARDVNDVTAAVAAKCLKEIAARMIRDREPR